MSAEALVRLPRKSEVLNAPGIKDEAGNALISVACKTHRAEAPGKNVPYGRLKYLGFMLETRNLQCPVLKHNTKNGVDFFADISTDVVS